MEHIGTENKEDSQGDKEQGRCYSEIKQVMVYGCGEKNSENGDDGEHQEKSPHK